MTDDVKQATAAQILDGLDAEYARLWGETIKEREQARARITALEAALREIALWCDEPTAGASEHHVRDIARRVLGEPTDE